MIKVIRAGGASCARRAVILSSSRPPPPTRIARWHKPASPSKKTPVGRWPSEAIPDAAASALGGVRAAAALSSGKRSGGSISHTRKTKIDLVEGPYPMAVKVKHIESGGASQKAELCLLPCEYQLQPAKLLDLVKNTWRLELPNLIVACDIGSAHPLQLGTTMLAELPQFQSWLADAQRHRAAAADRAAGIAPVAAEATDAVPSSSFAAAGGGGEEPPARRRGWRRRRRRRRRRRGRRTTSS